MSRQRIIAQCSGALESLKKAAKKLPHNGRDVVKIKALLERLAAGEQLRSPDLYNKEGVLPGDGGHFYALKGDDGLRCYGWWSKRLSSTFIVSHYKYKKRQDLDSADTARVSGNWRRVEAEGEEP